MCQISEICMCTLTGFSLFELWNLLYFRQSGSLNNEKNCRENCEDKVAMEQKVFVFEFKRVRKRWFL